MKRKVAIITLHGNYNFGNRLQAFATQTYFEKLGFSVSLIPSQGSSSSFDPRKTLEQLSRKLIHLALWPTKYERTRQKLLSQSAERHNYIAGFSDEYLKEDPAVNYIDLDADLKNRYDYFVTGSDQVWHGWDDNPDELEFFMLTFAEPTQRLTIAPSFGFDQFPGKYIDVYKRGLEGFEYLSVREAQGAKLIKELTGKDATVLLDPTMLIDVSEWRKIIRRPRQYIDDNYIFVYRLSSLLSGVRKDVGNSVRSLADETGMRVVDIMDAGSDCYIYTRPDEFLYWICNARLVVTDSFHATAFSILFGRPFVAAKRDNSDNMGSRLDTLLEKFGLEDRRYETQKRAFLDESDRSELFVTHYETVPETLEAERKKAREFFHKCFHDTHDPKE